MLTDAMTEQPSMLTELPARFAGWREELNAKREKEAATEAQQQGERGSDVSAMIGGAMAVRELSALVASRAGAGREVLVTTSVGSHQMWAAQGFEFERPNRQLITSGSMGLGSGLPAAIGAAVARPGALIIDVDGDGSFLMNIQELATLRTSGATVKVIILNNQALGMASQVQDELYNGQGSPGVVHLGLPGRHFARTGDEAHVFPDFVAIATAFGIPSRRVLLRDEVRDAMAAMLDCDGPFVLDVAIHPREHVLQHLQPGAQCSVSTVDKLREVVAESWAE